MGSGPSHRSEHTGPVKTFPDLVDHVPTSCEFMAKDDEEKSAVARTRDCNERTAMMYQGYDGGGGGVAL